MSDALTEAHRERNGWAITIADAVAAGRDPSEHAVREYRAAMAAEEAAEAAWRAQLRRARASSPAGLATFPQRSSQNP